MKLFGNFELRNKNNKPQEYHKIKKDRKTGKVILKIDKTYFADCYCDACRGLMKENNNNTK